jgi:HSP20 family molecular chaperone IbpA
MSLYRPLFDQVFCGPESFGTRLDIKEGEKVYVLEMEIPGTEKNAISVNVYNDTVTIEAEVQSRP